MLRTNSRSGLPIKSTMVMFFSMGCFLAIKKMGKLSSRSAHSTAVMSKPSLSARAYALRATRKVSRSFNLAASTRAVQAASELNSGTPVQFTIRRDLHSRALWPVSLQSLQVC
ncbi:hypothetical protein K504DRAFT_110504 [Pleomassaria siparia CBS 279.74]|uniref:Uncharacterized protein n=1 Tax=Pleomassaria siparia CBS 279.74 TaxID=1314801 RepID=A0A6G1JWL5_9PLEO|nr:hypothetical protein K504DRAFT_110504 [Pleomassaria siparia CBS 279.74]